MSKIRLNITDEQGVLFGTVDLTVADIRAARRSPAAAQSIVEDIAIEVGLA